MHLTRRFAVRGTLFIALMVSLTLLSTRMQADIEVTGTCAGVTTTLPFTDVAGTSIFFCSIAQIYFQGISFGTSPTTYSASASVTREQMAAFLARTQNSALNRGSRRAALNQFWTTTPRYEVTQGAGTLGTTPVASNPERVASDGADIWVASRFAGVSRVRASDGKLLEIWTGATLANGVLIAMGRVFVTGSTSPGRLYVIDPSQPPGDVTTLSTGLGNGSGGIAFAGQRIWTANINSVSIITPGVPFTVINVGAFTNLAGGILYDGANIWVTDSTSPGHLYKLNSVGGVIDTVTVGRRPQIPIYDGTNIWVPNFDSASVSVVRPSDGEVLATLAVGDHPMSAAFDGQRILITNFLDSSVSLFRAVDFAPLGTFSTGTDNRPFGACSDGLNFWIALNNSHSLARF